jgi:hypothetical protein
VLLGVYVLVYIMYVLPFHGFLRHLAQFSRIQNTEYWRDMIVTTLTHPEIKVANTAGLKRGLRGTISNFINISLLTGK